MMGSRFAGPMMATGRDGCVIGMQVAPIFLIPLDASGGCFLLGHQDPP